MKRVLNFIIVMMMGVLVVPNFVFADTLTIEVDTEDELRKVLEERKDLEGNAITADDLVVNITKDIEYGDVTSHTEGGTSYTVLYAADHKDGGVQFAELNAEEIGALYQDIISAPCEEIKWRFSHARRDNQSWASNVQNRMYIVEKLED